MSGSASAVAPSIAVTCTSSSSLIVGGDAHSTHASAACDDVAETLQRQPTEHGRQRKSWTEEEKRNFWKQKKMAKRERTKAVAAERRKAQQELWEHLSEGEREARRSEAALLHERRRQAEAALLRQCETQLADPHVPAIVFDLSFAWCMTMANTKSTVSQVKLSYSALRTAGFPFRPFITSLMGKEASDTEHDASAQATVLQGLDSFEGFRRFPPCITQRQHWSELFAPSRVVFLTADSPNTLAGIEPDTAYVIGAFVDHNANKGLSYACAQRHGVRTARLPITETVVLGNRCKVLTINHVANVLIHYAQLCAAGTPNWAQAIENALPTRRTRQAVNGRRKRRRVGEATSGDQSSRDDEGLEEEADDGGDAKGTSDYESDRTPAE
ncbi:hypothetical protein LSCM1_03930 [Leishmania martiniquensis]|uniref:tRNA (guanine(9)-N(1))-methyltransferase n=1 Tax=Leishmania martiniquensis TaxID=1580590 RepID=A0A836GFB3_9TRYP|nr:hypothetical protein LSCM1_03930 [Leishmania martiniquensis]